MKNIPTFEDFINESIVNEALSAIDSKKLTKHDTLTPKVNSTLISNARNGILKMMNEPDGKTHYWNPKTKEYIAKTITYNGKGEYLYSDGIDKDGNLMESKLNEATQVQKDYASKIHNQIEGDDKYKILDAIQRNQKDFDPLTVNIATGYAGTSGMEHRLDRLKTLSPTKLKLILAELTSITESVNEGDMSMPDGVKEFAADEKSEGKKAEIYLATFDGKTIKAQSTNKTWEDGTPVTKYFTRNGYKDYKIKGQHYIIEGDIFWYFRVGQNWFAVKRANYGTPPFEY